MSGTDADKSSWLLLALLLFSAKREPWLLDDGGTPPAGTLPGILIDCQTEQIRRVMVRAPAPHGLGASIGPGTPHQNNGNLFPGAAPGGTVLMPSELTGGGFFTKTPGADSHAVPPMIGEAA